jgi:hypothetical protein
LLIVQHAARKLIDKADAKLLCVLPCFFAHFCCVMHSAEKLFEYFTPEGKSHITAADFEHALRGVSPDPFPFSKVRSVQYQFMCQPRYDHNFSRALVGVPLLAVDGC